MKPKSSRPVPPIGAQCYCGEPALITVGLRDLCTTWGDVARSAYCLEHFDCALIAIERIRYDREMSAT